MSLAARAESRLIHLYRLLASGRSRCRYYPGCSTYGLEALEVHGFFRGNVLILRRFLRCQPFGSWGFDPVPPRGPLPSVKGFVKL